jgi:hypothetical protein
MMIRVNELGGVETKAGIREVAGKLAITHESTAEESGKRECWKLTLQAADM